MQRSTQQNQWWHAVDRRTFGKGTLAFATLLSMSGCNSEETITGDTLTLQQKHGWNMGAEESRLFFVGGGPSGQDATGSTAWQPYTDPGRLMDAWRPRTDAWEPFFVPTLIQSLRQDSLRQQMRPLVTSGMREAFARGETLRQDLLSQVQNPEETFFIADLPGPETVAFGAGMAGWADLIVTFDNWPHPWGVVRSHETLAALIAYAGLVQERAANLPASASGLLLLDNRRLSDYTDAATQFDNRYLATGVPSATHLQRRGVRHVMYVIPDRSQQQERDDLNAAFVAYRDAGIEVTLFPLTDLKKVVEEVPRTAPDGTTQTVREAHYYYGGGLGSHLGFFLMYSLLAPRPVLYYPPYAGRGYAGRSTTVGDLRRPTTVRPPSYTPRQRPTMFSGTRVGGSRGVGRSRPSGFGQTTVRSSGGRVTGLQRRSRTSSASRSSGSGIFGRSRRSGRSGSFGRGGSFSL